MMTGEKTTAEEKQNSFDQIIAVALELLSSRTDKYRESCINFLPEKEQQNNEKNEKATVSSCLDSYNCRRIDGL
jgi:hypothetical protein